MAARVSNLHGASCVQGVARSVEDGTCIVLLGLVIEREDDFTRCVDARVIVVSILWRGDPITDEHNWGGDPQVWGERYGKVGPRIKRFQPAAADQLHPPLL